MEVYHNQRRIALHDRVLAKYGYITIKEHLPSSHQYLTEWNPTKFMHWAREADVYTEEYIFNVLEKKAPGTIL